MLRAILTGTTIGAVYGLMALGLVLVYKATGVLNIAQGEIGTFSIYAAWVASTTFGDVLGVFHIPGTPVDIPIIGLGLPLVLAVLIAIAFGTAMGIAMERIAIRPIQDAPRVTLTVVTLGVTTVLVGLQFAFFGEQPRELAALVPGGLSVVGTFLEWGRLLAILITAGLGLGLFVFFRRTLFGLGVLASAQNVMALRLMGVPLKRVSMFTWGVGGALAALAGVILSPTIGAFHPFFMTLILIPSLAAALIGGLTSLPGAFVGGLVVGIVQSVVVYLWGAALPGIEFAAYFALILGVLLLRPRGLLGAEA